MLSAKFVPTVTSGQQKIATRLILATAITKEIEVTLPAGQVMKEHQAPYPITVHLLSGAVAFGVDGQTMQLTSGDILSLEAKVPHDLRALNDSVVRLSLYQADSTERVAEVANEPI